MFVLIVIQTEVTMIEDLDGFAQWISNEATAKRITRARADKILAAIDTVENAIEDLGY